MKQIAILYILIILCLISCDKTDLDNSPKDEIVVQTIEATANFDLSARKDWVVYVGSQRYHFETEGNKLRITSPAEEPFSFPYEATTGNIIIQMVPKDYGKERAESKIPFIIEDQSTIERFMNADRLRFAYNGEAKTNITGITIYHFNTLLTFSVSNLPEDAKVYIEQIYDQKITPLKEDKAINSFKAIVFPNNQYVSLLIETPGKSYKAIVPPLPTSRSPGMAIGTGNSSILSFDAEINGDDELEIKNYRKTSLSSEWPISQ